MGAPQASVAQSRADRAGADDRNLQAALAEKGNLAGDLLDEWRIELAGGVGQELGAEFDDQRANGRE